MWRRLKWQDLILEVPSSNLNRSWAFSCFFPRDQEEMWFQVKHLKLKLKLGHAIEHCAIESPVTSLMPFFLSHHFHRVVSHHFHRVVSHHSMDIETENYSSSLVQSCSDGPKRVTADRQPRRNCNNNLDTLSACAEAEQSIPKRQIDN